MSGSDGVRPNVGVTGILGGRFDPPHLGHLALARRAIDHFGLEQLLVTVVADPAHKGSVASPEHRLAMVRLTFAELPALVELEAHRYTVDALEARGYAAGGADEPVFLIGADELEAFHTWKRPERVLELARLGVATRPGYRPESDSPRVEPFELEPHEVSSTEIRARAGRGEPLDGLVTPAVARYIAERGLYARG